MYIEPGTILCYQDPHGDPHVLPPRLAADTYWVVIDMCGNSVNVYEVSTGDTVWTSYNFLRNKFFKVHTYVSSVQDKPRHHYQNQGAPRDGSRMVLLNTLV